MSSAPTTTKNSFEQETEKGISPSPQPQEATKEVQEIQEVHEPPPDGGLHAWMTVFATFLASFMAFGTGTFTNFITPKYNKLNVLSLRSGNVWGIYQDAYTTRSDSRFLDVSLFKIGFVGGTSVGFGFAAGPFGNILVSKFGIRAPMLIGVLMMSVALELASISHRYWELLLSQGIMFG